MLFIYVFFCVCILCNDILVKSVGKLKKTNCHKIDVESFQGIGKQSSISAAGGKTFDPSGGCPADDDESAQSGYPIGQVVR